MVRPHLTAKLCLTFPAVRPDIRGRDFAERDQKRDKERTVHYLDRHAGSHPRLHVQVSFAPIVNVKLYIQFEQTLGGKELQNTIE